MSAVHIEDLRVAAGPRVLLHLPRLQLAAGEHLVIVGPNGAGKSTLLRCLGGFVRPAQGQVQVLGRTLAPGAPARALLRAHRRDVGQVLQGLHLVARLTVLENTLIGALGRLHGGAAWRSCWRQYPAPEVEAAMAALQAVGLASRCDERVDRLSGGERQKVAMARVLLQRPRLVLADEPTASLDPAATQAQHPLAQQWHQGRVVHDGDQGGAGRGTAQQGNGFLRGGQVVLDGPVAALDTAQARLYAGAA